MLRAATGLDAFCCSGSTAVAILYPGIVRVFLHALPIMLQQLQAVRSLLHRAEGRSDQIGPQSELMLIKTHEGAADCNMSRRCLRNPLDVNATRYTSRRLCDLDVADQRSKRLLEQTLTRSYKLHCFGMFGSNSKRTSKATAEPLLIMMRLTCCPQL